MVLYQATMVAAAASDSWPVVALDGVFAGVLFFLAYSLWTAEAWAWLTTFVVEGINVIFSTATLVFVPGTTVAWITASVGALLLALLARPSLRASFGRPSPAHVVKR